MAVIQKFSANVIDYAERLSGMADVAEGKKERRRGSMRRWIALPASGAALYALVRSDFFSRQAKDVFDEAKSRASDLPDDLVKRIRETVEEPSTGNGARSSKRSARARSTRKRSSTRKAATAGR
jgi:hypothetical protein